MSESGNCADCGVLHVFVNGRCAHVESASENVRETDNVVHLVRIVATARCKDEVATACHSFFVADFRSRVCKSKDNRLVGHAANHFASEDVALGKTHKHVCALHGIFERFDVGAFRCKESLCFGEALAVLADNALAIAHHKIFFLETERQVETCASASSSTSAVHDHLHVANALACNFNSVQEASGRNDSRTVLVIVHHRNIKLSLESVFDFEAFRSLNVFEVDATERRCNALHDFDKLLRILFVDFDVEHVNARINFEKQGLTFHHRLTSECANIAETKHSRTVTDHSDEVALARVFVSEVLVFFDFKTR